MVAYVRKKWVIDPDPNTIQQGSKVWVCGRSPLLRLQWDPCHYRWKNPYSPSTESISFFQYTVKMGRHILMVKKQPKIAAEKFWSLQGISLSFGSQFWHTLWDKEYARKITAFHWMLVHKELLVEEWLCHPTMFSLCRSC